MLKILLESFLLEVALNNLNADKEINYLYETLNKSHITDLQKEIKAASMDIQEFKILIYSILNSEEFKQELKDLNITLPTNETTLETVYNEVITVLQSNDKNASYDEILSEHDYNYKTARHELLEVLDNIIQNEVEYNSSEYNFYNNLYIKIWETL